jgi:hypothetical protein
MSVEAHNHGAGAGPVMVDVGNGYGALVLHTASSMAGVEIEISPAGEDGHRSHVAVLPRPPAGAGHAAVYPSLAAGTWNLWDPVGGCVALRVRIDAGRVSEVAWPNRRQTRRASKIADIAGTGPGSGL